MAAKQWKVNLSVFIASVIVIGLIFVGMVFYSLFYVRYGEEIDLSGIELYHQLPELKYNIGRIHRNDPSELYFEVHKIARKYFVDYVEACKKMGFTIAPGEYDDAYSAYTLDGYHVYLSYQYNYMTISIDKYGEIRDIEWPDRKVVAYLPKPKIMRGTIFTIHEQKFRLFLGEVEREDFEAYVEACKERGFVREALSNENEYSAYHKDGYKVEIIYLDKKIMYVEIMGGYYVEAQ